MEGTVAALLSGWESFYVITGAAAAALIGLQFVVIVLGTELNSVASTSATRAFATPTIVHFCAVLYVAGIVSAPWPTLTGVAVALCIGGLAGCMFVLLTLRQMMQQSSYRPVLEDWIWHDALPFGAYAALIVAALLLERAPIPSLFVIGASTLLLLFIGIHNAWDAVVYIAQRGPVGAEEPNEE